MIPPSLVIVTLSSKLLRVFVFYEELDQPAEAVEAGVEIAGDGAVGSETRRASGDVKLFEGGILVGVGDQEVGRWRLAGVESDDVEKMEQDSAVSCGGRVVGQVQFYHCGIAADGLVVDEAGLAKQWCSIQRSTVVTNIDQWAAWL